MAGLDQISNEAFLDVKIALVLASISNRVSLVEHTPDIRSEAERVR